MINFFRRLFKRNAIKDFDAAPEGVCPNCWGDQEYGNIIREKFKDKQISVNNKQDRHAFIQDFIVTNLSGIKLKSSVNGHECPTCKVNFKN